MDPRFPGRVTAGAARRPAPGQAASRAPASVLLESGSARRSRWCSDSLAPAPLGRATLRTALVAAIALALCLAQQEAGPVVPDGGAAPVPLLSATAQGSREGEEATRLLRDGEAMVSPAARFAVETGAPLSDARLVLYDGQEALVEAEGGSEIGSAASRFTLAPTRPLRPASRYVLRLEGAQGRELHDLAGRAYRAASFPLLVAGTAPADPPPRKGKKRRRR